MKSEHTYFSKMLGMALALLLLLVTPAAAQTVAYDSYTYNYGTGKAEAVASPHPYLPLEEVSLRERYAVGNLADFCRDAAGNWYIADSGNHRILLLDARFDLRHSIETIGEGEQFSAPEGLCLLPDGNICVADTGNRRLVTITPEGELVSIFTLEGQEGVRSEFQPIRVGAGHDGQLYVISRNDYTGILELDEQGNFLGYLGSTNVTYNWIDWLWKQVMTETQKDKLIQFVPVEYNSMAVDEEGFIFAVSASETEALPVRRLNPSGVDVLSHNGYVEAIDGDADIRSAFVDVCAGQAGTYHVLDSRMGRVFTYSEDGYLLYVFGGLGTRDGCTVQPVSIESDAGHIYLLDAGTGNIWVYAITPYAQRVLEGIAEYNAGRYEESKAIWESVLQDNSNYDLAYAQIGRSLLRQGEYRQAMDYFYLGNLRGDRVVLDGGYNKAFTQYRRELLMAWWWVILLGVAALVVGGAWLGRRWKKSAAGPVVTLRDSGLAVQWRFSKHLLFHPFDGFWDMKREKKGSLPFALGLIGLWLVTNILTEQATGFLFAETTLSTVDIFSEIRNVLILFALFTVGNWSVTTLMGGEGSYRDIVMLFGYATLPLSLIGIPLCFATNFLTYSEAAYVTMLQGVATGWCLFLLFFGLMTVHQYSVGKTIGTVILTLVAMAILIFVAMVLMEMIANMTGFVSALIQEVFTRV